MCYNKFGEGIILISQSIQNNYYHAVSTVMTKPVFVVALTVW